jgi:hypothetical protein
MLVYMFVHFLDTHIIFGKIKSSHLESEFDGLSKCVFSIFDESVQVVVKMYQ